MTSAASLITANRPGLPGARASRRARDRARRVRHKLADPRDQQGTCHRLIPGSAEHRADRGREFTGHIVHEQMVPVANNIDTARDHVHDIRRCPGREQRRQRVAVRAARQPRRIERHRHQVRVRPWHDLPGVRPAEARVPAAVAAAAWSAGVKCPRCRLMSRCDSSSQRASSIRSMTLCPSLPSASGDPAAASAGAGPTPSARSASVSGQKQAAVRDPPAAPRHGPSGAWREPWSSAARARPPRRAPRRASRRTPPCTRRSPAAAPTGARGPARHAHATTPSPQASGRAPPRGPSGSRPRGARAAPPSRWGHSRTRRRAPPTPPPSRRRT